MGRRKREAANMGKALIKNRFRGKTVSRGGESFLHTTEMNDGYEGRSLNLQSLTDQSSMADFLLTAELAGRDFTAEKENVQLVTPQLNSGVLSGEKLKKVKEQQDLYKSLLRIPRRPPWQESTPADKLRQDEQMSFLDWRRQLARLQEEEHIVITPYEKNLEFWRQLWRVIERSDVVVQIVDARNPLLFWCPDVDKYVKEVDPHKETLLLINKADLLTVNQRQAWAEYFAAQGVHVVFWSAVEEAVRLEREKKAAGDEENKADDEEHPAHDHDTSDDASDDENSEDLHDAAVKDTERTSNDKTDDRSADDDGMDDARDTVHAENTDSCDIVETSQKTSDDIVVKDPQNCEPESGRNNTELSDTKNKDAVENDVDEDDVEACDDEDDNSDDYDTIEEYTDDEDDVNSVDSASDSREARRNEDGRQIKTQHTGKSDSSETASPGQPEQKDSAQPPQAVAVADSRLQTTEELLALFRGTARVNHLEGVTTVGMVGYPNVGKSSTINTILQTKKVAVSATPGRTKHFQTLYVDRDLMLCDCPGLVFPSFVNSKAELVVNGILPIDQLQDSEPPVELVCHRVGRSALEALYHLNLPPPEEWEDPDKAPSAYDLLQAYGALRGFMSHKGNPDRPRAARYILKDFVSGKLLFCHPPPGIEAAAFQKPPYGGPREVRAVLRTSSQKTASEKKTEALDREFFTQTNSKVHAIGPRAVSNYVRTEGLRPVGVGQGQGQGHSSEVSTPHSSQSSIAGKPWKRHNNRNKKEKLRRVYKDLDQH